MRLLLATALFGVLSLSASAAGAYEVEADSTGNTVFILLRNLNPSADFESVSVGEDQPSFVAQVAASIVPGSVAANGSDLAAVDFDVSAGATLGSTGDLEITVSGTASGQPIAIVFTLPLVVVADAAEAQGSVGQGVPAPDPGGTDSDGDGVTNAHEIAFGTDPLDSNSVPGETGAGTSIPALGAVALAALAALLLLTGTWLASRRPARRSQ